MEDSFCVLVHFSLLGFFLCLLISMGGTAEVLVPTLWLFLITPCLSNYIFEGIDSGAQSRVHLCLHGLQMVLHVLPKSGQESQRLVYSFFEVLLCQFCKQTLLTVKDISVTYALTSFRSSILLLLRQGTFTWGYRDDLQPYRGRKCQEHSRYLLYFSTQLSWHGRGLAPYLCGNWDQTSPTSTHHHRRHSTSRLVCRGPLLG